METVSTPASRASVPTLPPKSVPRLWVAVGSPRVRVKGLVTGVKGGKQIFQRVQNILVIKYSKTRQHTL